MRKWLVTAGLALVVLTGCQTASEPASPLVLAKGQDFVTPPIGNPIPFDNTIVRNVNGTRTLSPSASNQIGIFLTPEGIKRFTDMTKENLGKVVELRFTDELSIPIPLKAEIKWEIMMFTLGKNTPELRNFTWRQISKMKQRLK